MKVGKYIALSLFTFFTASVSLNASTDITDLLKGIGSGSSSSSGDILSGVGSVINGVLTSSNLEISDVVGKWSYVEPAVEFKSENLLQKAGGAVASSTITNKIKPYFDKAGLEKLVVTINEDGTFSMGTGKINLSGTITKGETAGQFVFAFKTIASISIGKINAYMSKNVSGQLTLTFDASKIISLVNGISKIANNSTVSSVASILNSYDGLTVGFLLKKD